MSTIVSTVSSFAFVANDLIVDRSIGLKICFIILCILQLISSWLTCVFYTTAYIRHHRSLEIILSWTILGVGNYLITGMASTFIYWKRWKKSSNRARRKTVQQNHDAWMVLRLFLTLLGLAPVARYIESITVIRTMLALEMTYLPRVQERNRQQINVSVISGSRVSERDNHAVHKSRPISAKESRPPAQPKDPRLPMNRGNGPVSHATSQPRNISQLKHPQARMGESHQSIRSDQMNDKAHRKIHQAQRQMRRCQQDAADVALYSGFFGAAPMGLAQFFIFMYKDASRLTDTMTTEYVFGILSLIFSLLWSATSLVHFYPAERVISETDFERGLGHKRSGHVVLFLSRLSTISVRCLTLATFPIICTFWIFLFLGLHWAIIFGTLIAIYLCRERSKDSSSFHQSGMSESWSLWLLNYAVYSWIAVFDFVNGNTPHTRLRCLLYYTLCYVENVALVVAWFMVMPLSAAWYRLPVLLIVLCLSPVAFLLLQVYYFYYHEDKGTFSICGLFCDYQRSQQKENFRKYNSHPVGEEIFGTSTSQVARPFHSNMGSSQYPGSPWHLDGVHNYRGKDFSHSGTLSGMTDSLFYDSVSQVAARAVSQKPSHIPMEMNKRPVERSLPPQPINNREGNFSSHQHNTRPQLTANHSAILQKPKVDNKVSGTKGPETLKNPMRFPATAPSSNMKPANNQNPCPPPIQNAANITPRDIPPQDSNQRIYVNYSYNKSDDEDSTSSDTSSSSSSSNDDTVYRPKPVSTQLPSYPSNTNRLPHSK